LVIADRISKMTRAVILERIDAETIAAAFLDYWVAAYEHPTTVLSDERPPVSLYVLLRGFLTPRDLQPVLHDVSSADKWPSEMV